MSFLASLFKVPRDLFSASPEMARFLVAAVLVGSTAALAGPSSSNFLRRRMLSTSGAPTVGRTAAALPRTQADMQPRLVAPSGGAGVSAITADDVATLPRPGTTVPGSMAFSPDGRYLTYLLAPDAASLTRRLFARVRAGHLELHWCQDPGAILARLNLAHPIPHAPPSVAVYMLYLHMCTVFVCIFAYLCVCAFNVQGCGERRDGRAHGAGPGQRRRGNVF
jgi:hypothetical protein